MINAQPLAIVFVKGTAPGKWFDRFNERTDYPDLITMESDDAFAALIDGRATLALIRLPEPRLTDDFHKVDLYEETPGITVPKDSELTLLERISRADISDEIVNYEPGDQVDIQAVRDAVQVVAANVGVVIAPRPLLRSISSKQTEHREFSDGTPTQVSLVWRKADDCDMIQDFVGITKGRKATSSRQSQQAGKPKRKPMAKKRPVRRRR
ncbi:LysR family transcriptional regulator substrate-binding protein [Corynebacterium hindlerae]|uniref:LysR family transcriptional regulator substrate-binding protein n=1 Tax=Corynebacterium hindlerae TaxID=699041 RepID=UPI0031B6AF2C